MTVEISHVGFFGDGFQTFCLTDEMIAELERIAGAGIGALYLRIAAAQFNVAEMTEIIRLGLIGGGMQPEQAKALVETYARNRPLGELFPLALDVLDARWSGKPKTEAEAPVEVAA
jgi:hypothetical protein